MDRAGEKRSAYTNADRITEWQGLEGTSVGHLVQTYPNCKRSTAEDEPIYFSLNLQIHQGCFSIKSHFLGGEDVQECQ